MAGQLVRSALSATSAALEKPGVMVVSIAPPPGGVLDTTTTPRPPGPEASPVAVYLARLAPGSRRTMAGAIATMAELLAPGTPAASLPWHRLRYAHVQALRAHLAQRYAPATANRHLAALRGVLEEARRLGLMTRDEEVAATDVPPVRGSREIAGRMVTLPELRDCLQAAGPRDAAIVAVLYAGGLRRAELAGLQLEDLDVAGWTVRVKGKGNKVRRCPIGPARARLEAWLKIRGEMPGPLFTSNAPGHARDAITPDGVRVVLARLAEKAGARSFSPHDLRRTFVSELLDSGVDIATVQKMAGHAKVETTARYDRRGEEAAKRAVEKLRGL